MHLFVIVWVSVVVSCLFVVVVSLCEVILNPFVVAQPTVTRKPVQ